MGLPKINMPLFEMVMPSTGEKVKYRAYTVREEKIQLIAKESGSLDQIVMATKQIVNNCLIDYDVDRMSTFDLQYAMLCIRAKSVNNIIEFSIKDPETFEKVDLVFDVDKVSVHIPENHKKSFEVGENSYVYMRYPSFDELKLLQGIKENKTETIYKVMIACIDKIVVGDSIYSTSDFSETEIDEFVNSLPSSAIKSMEEFFKTMPVLRHEFHYKNNEGKEKTFVIQGMDAFFI